MGKFLKSRLSDLIGIIAIAIGALPVIEVVELAKSGEIISVIVTAIGGVLVGAGKGTGKDDAPAPGAPLGTGR